MRLIINFIFWIRGWKLDPFRPSELKRAVVIAAPHTTNWDFIYYLAGMNKLGMNPRFAIKQEWMRFPFGFIMRSLGAIGINRSPKKGTAEKLSMVDAMADLFKTNEFLTLGITPEGTRKRVTKWHLGFYHVALKANVPILLGYVDYKKKIAGVGMVIYPKPENLESDMRKIMDFYKDKNAGIPANFALDSRYSDSASTGS